MKNRTLLLVFVVLLASCAQIGNDNAGATATAPSIAARPRFAVPIDGLPVMGARDALVTLVAFVDYDCPFCARAEQTVEALRAKYGHDLRVAVAENPLPMHEHAREAALAALGAWQQGQFEAMHRALFARKGPSTQAELSVLARDLRLGAAFESAQTVDAAKTSLAHAKTLATSLEVRGAPIFFVNGRKITGAQPQATFEALVDEELAHARVLVASGVSPAGVYEAILAEARENPAPLEPPQAEPAAFVAETRTIGGLHLFGPRDAARTLVVFTDMECGFCAKLHPRLRAFADAHPNVRIVMRNRPLPMHPHARLAAKAAIAADAQGALAKYVSLLFENQTALDRGALVGHATRLGLDVVRFERDLDAPETERRLAEDEALATRLDVRGTPTSFVDGTRVMGAQPAETFEVALASHPDGH